ncbi:DEAD/DEAH box helicase [Halonotius terrestris]|uniref:ATP-dependent DNA helicase Hel308 n=1 Tax=Halonotius terrestris TaxID=2487750 RepID=A0A8J8PBX0_9EURY|nr:DEAD/DEAH box helicase [Halonotius terrestris]TQQ80998.1 DEAD/DEAH box helicase [Halonotius terrestris]
MHVGELPLATPHVAHFERQGIEELYPPQAETVEAGICDGENVMAAIPTASGKTLIAQLAMLTADGPGLYIVPLRALATEKHATFSDLPGADVGIATGDYDSPAAELAEHDIVVATSEKVDSAIRNGASWVDDIGCVVVDEVHLLGQTDRGPTLEVTLAHLRRLTPGVQLVALSATVANADEIADWLGATLIESDWRPVDLRTGVADTESVAYDDGTTETVAIDEGAIPPSADLETETTAALVDRALGDGGQSLAFVRSRREAESLADRLTRDVDDASDAGENSGDADDDTAAEQRERVASEIESLDGTVTGQRLADCVREGVAFHHAGLRSGHRALVESAFRNRTLDAICATPTLAAGVNVPARRVVVRDQQRYTDSAMEWLPVLEIHQMCGRAGRPHLDPYGEAILVGLDDPEALAERYLGAEPEAVESKLASEAALRTHVLSIIASGFAETEAGILDVLSATFYAHQTPVDDLAGIVAAVIEDLTEMAMVVREPAAATNEESSESDPATVLSATEIGATVSTQYITPETGARIVDGLRTAAKMDAPTALTALEIICDTPDMHDTYLGNEERAAIYEYARQHADEFTTAMTEADDFETWLEAVKTARILAEWSEGASIETLVEQYRLGPGDLDSRLERADWLLGAADALTDVLEIAFPAVRRVRDQL